MNLSKQHSFPLYGALSILGLLGVLPATMAGAQIVPDTTLGVEATTVIEDALVRGQEADLIDGGALRGSNLFHSFLEFNVGETQRVYFANPTGVENILSRVTGLNGSDIMGTLGVDGSANLFLLNPNGIIFGPNAQLDISGSFLASTAESFVFADGSEFSATASPTSELLKVSIPLGVQWGPGQGGPLTNIADLAVPDGQRLTLVGGEVIHTGSLTAPGGTVEVLGDRVSLLDSAAIDVSSATGGGTVLVGGDYQGQGTTPRAQRTLVGPEVTINANAIQNGDGGTVIIWSDEATQFYGTVLARGGNLEGDGGFVEVSSPGALVFDGQVDTTAPRGITGLLLIDPVNIRIIPDGTAVSPGEQVTTNLNLNLDDPPTEAVIFTSTINGAITNVSLQATNNIIFDGPINMVNAGFGLAAEALGSIEINADIGTNRGDINLVGRSINLNTANVGFEAQGSSTPGNISLQATTGNIQLVNSSISANTDNPLAAPNVSLNASGDILLIGESRVTASANSSGSGGTITLTNPQGSIRIESGSTISSSLGVAASSMAQSGGVNITTGELIIADGGIVRALTLGVGSGGSLNVNAERLQVDGILSASTLGISATGDGGVVTINAGDIKIGNAGFIGAQSDSDSTGNAGEVRINANRLLIEDSGRISAEAQGLGAAGSLTVNATGEVDINSGGRLTVSSEQDQAGNLTVNAASVRLNNSRIEATSSASGQGDESGSITIDLSGPLLLLENGSTITAQALNNADGGNVNLIVPNGFILARPSGNNDILASAEFGVGGNINVVTNAIFGIEERNPITDFSDFNASSEFNVDGVILLLTLGIDPSRGLAELPIDVVDVAGLVATGCVGDNRSGVDDQGEFTAVGRGGIAQSPAAALASPGGVANLATLDDDDGGSDRTFSPTSLATPPDRPIEAQGLVVDPDGNVVIAAAGTARSVAPSVAAALNCDAF